MKRKKKTKLQEISWIVKTDRPVRLSMYIFFMLSLTVVSQFGVKFFDLLMTNVTIELARQQVTFTGTITPMDSLPDYDASKPMAQGGAYATAYMGNYVHWEGNNRVASKDHGGSHLGIDIYADVGTPVASIANGVVMTVKDAPSGFGKHVVVLHPNFPSLTDPNKKEDLYSSYSHLDSILVKEGDLVEKGQKIALSGNTGISTAPHLHFQMDTESSPYKPWWPFTYSEAQSKGLDFFTAINAGLGQSQGIAHTLNPMLYVQKYKDYSGVDLVSAVGDSETAEEKAVGDIAIPAPVETEPEKESEPEKLVADSFKLSLAKNNVEVGEKVTLNVEVLSADGRTVTDFKKRSRFNSKNGVVDFKNRLTTKFKNGKLQTTITPKDYGEIEIQLVAGSVKGTVMLNVNQPPEPEKKPEPVVIEEEVKEVAAEVAQEEKVKDEGVLDVVSEVVEKAVADIVSTDIFTDVAADHPYADAIAFMKRQKIVNGYEDGSFKPDKVVARVEALKMIMKAVEINVDDRLKTSEFPDVEKGAWFVPYVAKARDLGAVKGYGDGSFKPQKDVTKVEALKIMMSLMDQTPAKSEGKPFADVEAGTWFADYVTHAKQKSWIRPDVNNNYQPHEGLTRAGMADIIYNLLK